jgi:hypothetical protein
LAQRSRFYRDRQGTRKRPQPKLMPIAKRSKRSQARFEAASSAQTERRAR